MCFYSSYVALRPTHSPGAHKLDTISWMANHTPIKNATMYLSCVLPVLAPQNNTGVENDLAAGELG